MNEASIITLIRRQLPPKFHVQLKNKGTYYDVDILSPNEVLGIRLAVAEDILQDGKNLRIIGRMANHAFTNRPWAIIDGQHRN